MPELPEVETTRRGIANHILDQIITGVVVRQRQLRWVVPDEVATLANQRILDVRRRAKYLRIITRCGEIVIHLGMSGSLRICDADTPAEKHDYVDFILSNNKLLRFRDPRRFGAVLFAADASQFPLFSKLGPEPLEDEFDSEVLFRASRNRRISVKQLIMDAHVVVGVGNIYASESLFRAGIHPRTRAGRISKERYEKLTIAIKEVLKSAIEKGGTTLKDFVSADGQAGYFAIELQVYGREAEACYSCEKSIRRIVLAQRSTFYCPHCQR